MHNKQLMLNVDITQIEKLIYKNNMYSYIKPTIIQ